jgi:hypothetical protein
MIKTRTSGHRRQVVAHNFYASFINKKTDKHTNVIFLSWIFCLEMELLKE